MQISIDKITVYVMNIYIATLFFMSYDTGLNMISKAIFLLTFLVVALKILDKGTISGTSGYYTWLFSFMLLSLITCFICEDFSIAWSMTLTFLQILLLAFITINTYCTENDIEGFIDAYFIGGAVMCLYTIIRHGPINIIRSIMSGVRVGAEVNSVNILGFYCVCMISIALYKAFFRNKKIYYLYMIIPAVLSLSTGSRKSIVVLLVAFIVMLSLKSGNVKFSKILVVTIIIISVFAIISNIDAFKPTFVRFTEFLNIFDEETVADRSTMTRIEMIRFGWEKFKERPILGYGGINAYNILYQEVYGLFRPAHCNYIQVLVGYGVVGFALYYGLYVYIIGSLIKYGTKYNYGVSVLLLDFVILNLVNELTVSNLTDKLFFITISVIVAFCNIAKRAVKASESEV